MITNLTFHSLLKCPYMTYMVYKKANPPAGQNKS